MNNILYTMGHSNHDMTTFINLLQMHGITALGDVRSHPYSRYVPHYSYKPLKVALAKANIAYVFLGKELGVRPEDSAYYHQGKVQYDLLAQGTSFKKGLIRIQQGMERYQIALMCAEKDPIECHRALLIARHLFESGMSIQHILADGTLESHSAMESRLLNLCKLPEGDMFNSRAQFIAQAYKVQEERIAYQTDIAQETGTVA